MKRENASQIGLWKTLSFAVLLGISLPLYAETDTELYQSALALEKGSGDLRAAVERYGTIVERYRAGRADARLAARAQQRLALLRKRLGLAAIPETPIDPGSPDRLTGRADVTARQLRALREAFGVTGAPKDIAERLQFGDAAQPVSALARRIQSIGEMSGKWSSSDSSADSVGGAGRGRKVGPIEQRLRAFRRALGAKSLAERVEEQWKRHLRRRSLSPAELYQAGLVEEKGKGDLKAAIARYSMALRQADRIDAALTEQIRYRLARCRERLGIDVEAD